MESWAMLAGCRSVALKGFSKQRAREEAGEGQVTSTEDAPTGRDRVCAVGEQPPNMDKRFVKRMCPSGSKPAALCPALWMCAHVHTGVLGQGSPSPLHWGKGPKQHEEQDDSL